MNTDVYAWADALRMSSSIVLKVARQELVQRLEEARIDIPPRQFVVLRCMKGRTLTLVEVSREMGLDPSTLAPMIESFVQRGLVQRDRDPHDRRRAPLTLTKAGEELLALGTRLSEQSLLVKGLETLGEEKSQQLVNLLHEFITTLSTLSCHATGGEGSDAPGSSEAYKVFYAIHQ